MSGRWIAASLFGLMAGACLAQEPGTELPPLLAIPNAPIPTTGKPNCAPCRTDYNPNHAYLPNGNPDRGSGACGDECDKCRRCFLSGDFVYAVSRDLGRIDRATAYGYRVGGGAWFDDGRSLGLQFDFLNVHDPFRRFFAGPTLVDAPLTVTTADLNLRGEVARRGGLRFDALLGYRYLQLHERALLGTRLPGGALALGDVSDRNEVHAGQAGMAVTYRCGSYFAEAQGLFAVGANFQTRNVFGTKFTDTEVSYIPEARARVGYQIGEGVWFTLGYNFLLVTNVLRPTLIDSTTFYLHGATVGLEVRF